MSERTTLSPAANLRTTVYFWTDSFVETINVVLNIRWRWATTIACVLLLQGWLAAIHQPWLDEWQALQIALQSPDWPALLENLRYEGHPPLWYALLRGTSLILPPLTILMTIQVVIALTGQYLILSWNVFARTERMLISLSYFILIEFGTVSRSLSLGAILTIAFFRARNIRLQWTLVSLLPMIDFQFGLMSLVAMALLWREGKWSWTGTTIWLASSLFSAWSIRPAPDMLPALERGDVLIQMLSALQNLGSMLLPLHWDNGWNWKASLPHMVGIPFGMLFLFLVRRLLKARPFSLHLMATFVAANLAFTLFVYPLAVRHWTLVPLLLILLMARLRETQTDDPDYRPLFRLWLFVIALAGLWGAMLSATRPFDTAYQAASFIRSHGLIDKQWASWPDSRGQGLAALLNRDFITIGKGCRQSFMRWNFRNPIYSTSDLSNALQQVTDRYGRYYLVSDHDIRKLPLKLKTQMIAHYPAGYDGQAYWLYIISPDKPETKLFAPPCLPKRLPIQQD